MAVNINTDLMLRLLDIQEFFTNQWLGSFPHDHQKLAELINIKKQQLSLKELAKKEDEEGDEAHRRLEDEPVPREAALRGQAQAAREAEAAAPAAQTDAAAQEPAAETPAMTAHANA